MAAFRLLFLCLAISLSGFSNVLGEERVPLDNVFKRGHTNNWAVLVCTSRFWFNYRHVANVLSVYRSVKRLGIPDSHIILMTADDMACNARNPRPGTVFNNVNQHINLYGDDVEVDYRGYDVTAENFIRILTGRLPESVPRSKRLLSDERSNILIYMTGHGGDGFIKFQDAEEITSVELADAFEQMWQKRRYHELFLIVDSCQAHSMTLKIYSPNVVGVGSSLVGQDSLSHHDDPAIGVHVIDRYTYFLLQFLERIGPASKATVGELFEYTSPDRVMSTPGVRTDLFERDVDKTLLTDFFGSIHEVEISNVSSVDLKHEVICSSGDCVSNENLPKEHTDTRQFCNQFPIQEILKEETATSWPIRREFLFGAVVFSLASVISLFL
ncbi:GPI-anchor transamidase-like [Actinia tenebrosa]|uniref:GPI-anchor transamidase-like n=1 Tax=Actinia tenebrosa TaxID=6105 RepID=A0A6P8H6R2_ACTTE|nr:GPI-anchor transamidase-like [Actinia tenebrosa]